MWDQEWVGEVGLRQGEQLLRVCSDLGEIFGGFYFGGGSGGD